MRVAAASGLLLLLMQLFCEKLDTGYSQETHSYCGKIYCGLAHRCSCSVTAHALAGGLSVVYMRHMICWGLPRVSDGLTHRVHLCGARSLDNNHIGTAGCATLKAAGKGCRFFFCD